MFDFPLPNFSNTYIGPHAYIWSSAVATYSNNIIKILRIFWIMIWQEALQKLGFYSGEEDIEYSSFSSDTERAVKTWQVSSMICVISNLITIISFHVMLLPGLNWCERRWDNDCRAPWNIVSWATSGHCVFSQVRSESKHSSSHSTINLSQFWLSIYMINRLILHCFQYLSGPQMKGMAIHSFFFLDP